MKTFGVVLRGKINHIAQPVYLNRQGQKKIKLSGSEKGAKHTKTIFAVPIQSLICLCTNLLS